MGFVENKANQCIYLKEGGSHFIIHVLYVDDILLASNVINLLHETKCMLSKPFDMKGLGDAYYVWGIEIHRDKSQHFLGLSQNASINHVLKGLIWINANLEIFLLVKVINLIEINVLRTKVKKI